MSPLLPVSITCPYCGTGRATVKATRAKRPVPTSFCGTCGTRSFHGTPQSWEGYLALSRLVAADREKWAQNVADQVAAMDAASQPQFGEVDRVVARERVQAARTGDAQATEWLAQFGMSPDQAHALLEAEREQLERSQAEVQLHAAEPAEAKEEVSL